MPVTNFLFFFFLWVIYFVFFNYIFNWKIIALQNCVSYINTNQPQVYICPLPPLGCDRDLGLSSLCHTANSHWLSVLHMVMYMFQCYPLNSFLTLLPCVHKSVLYVLMNLFAGQQWRHSH